MADWPTEAEMDRRQAARVALMRRCLSGSETLTARYASEVARWQREGRVGFPPPPERPAAVRPPTEDERLIADGFVFTVRERRREEADLEHNARRARATREVTQWERLHATYRDLYGADEADRLMRS